MENNNVLPHNNIEVNVSSTDSSAPMPDRIYQLAKFRQRLMAFLLDMLIIFMLNFCLKMLLLPESVVSRLTSNNLFLGVTGSIYLVVMTRYFSQTLGKKAMGIMVIRADGLPMDWDTAVIRELFGKLVSKVGYLFLGYWFCLLSPKKRCWHDWFADTYVVSAPLKDKEFVHIPAASDMNQLGPREQL